jgi:glycosyltransferase involved in cell wall biosynthesis
MRLSVLVPAYNEAPTIEGLLGRIAAIPIVHEILAVDDGSTDGTAAVLGRLERDGCIRGLRCLYHERNRGKGAAIRTALAQASGEVVIVQDADLEYHPEDYPAAFRLIADGWADAVFGSRFLGPHRVFYFTHFVGNRALTLLANILFSGILTDMETGFKMVRTDVLRSLGLSANTFDLEVEITAKLLRRRFRLYEIPITYTGRTYEEGKKITWRDGVRALRAIVRFAITE